MPKSKIVHCKRNPKDNTLSIFKNHFTSGKVKFAYDLNEIVSYYNLYKDLMLFWKNLVPNFICDISYEILTENQEDETKKLLDFCKLSSSTSSNKTEELLKK